MFDNFGEMDSAKELTMAAEGLLREGDIENLKVLAKENGFDEDDVEDWQDLGVMITDEAAAIGKLKVEQEALKLPKDILITDWVNYVKKAIVEDENVAVSVRKKGKSLAECIAKIMTEAFANQWTVPKEIMEKSSIKASKVTFGIPSEMRVRATIKEYYGGRA